MQINIDNKCTFYIHCDFLLQQFSHFNIFCSFYNYSESTILITVVGVAMDDWLVNCITLVSKWLLFIHSVMDQRAETEAGHSEEDFYLENSLKMTNNKDLKILDKLGQVGIIKPQEVKIIKTGNEVMFHWKHLIISQQLVIPKENKIIAIEMFNWINRLLLFLIYLFFFAFSSLNCMQNAKKYEK